MVGIVNGTLAAISRFPDRQTARETEYPLYSPDTSDQCPDHPTSPRITATGQCRECWRAEQSWAS